MVHQKNGTFWEIDIKKIWQIQIYSHSHMLFAIVLSSRRQNFRNFVRAVFYTRGRNRCVNLTFLARLAGHTSGSFEISRQGSLAFLSPGSPRAICQKSCRSDENSPARDAANTADLSAGQIRYRSARKVHFATTLPTIHSMYRVGIWQTCRPSPPVAIPRKRCRSVCKKKFGGWG